MANDKLIRKVIREIEEDGESRPTWNQIEWASTPGSLYGEAPVGDTSCKTHMCFAGYTVLTATPKKEFKEKYTEEVYDLNKEGTRWKCVIGWRWKSENIQYDAQKLLALDTQQASILFSGRLYDSETGQYLPYGDVEAFKKLITKVTGTKFYPRRAKKVTGEKKETPSAG